MLTVIVSVEPLLVRSTGYLKTCNGTGYNQGRQFLRANSIFSLKFSTRTKKCRKTRGPNPLSHSCRNVKIPKICFLQLLIPSADVTFLDGSVFLITPSPNPLNEVSPAEHRKMPKTRFVLGKLTKMVSLFLGLWSHAFL